MRIWSRGSCVVDGMAVLDPKSFAFEVRAAGTFLAAVGAFEDRERRGRMGLISGSSKVFGVGIGSAVIGSDSDNT